LPHGRPGRPRPALVGSLPLVILYSFFVEHYVSAMTGAVKE
jgi:multiple sugar transport system permease protein